ncbi:MAG: DNA alkylation repair protein [Cytophagales bacterium]|nr:MAG: DNA alkylation repair protein [Cytophagales bacterium]TAF61168.1 MAG: DNA alkylation repair protein [Cytophagales bacterium]
MQRKPARRVSDIPASVLDLLNQGLLESGNLVEWLAINHAVLLSFCFNAINIKSLAELIQVEYAKLKKPTVMVCYQRLSPHILDYAEQNDCVDKIEKALLNHHSDSLRGYAAYFIAQKNSYTLEQKLEKIFPLAADKHFGVRELAWLALRPSLVRELEKSLSILSLWARNKDENIRRFASESTRPRGVWCEHIAQLKATPELALPILNSLCSDEAVYVQLSVGNWLNDASKSSPEFVRALCARWQAENPQNSHTIKIVKRALRSLEKIAACNQGLFFR